MDVRVNRELPGYPEGWAGQAELFDLIKRAGPATWADAVRAVRRGEQCTKERAEALLEKWAAAGGSIEIVRDPQTKARVAVTRRGTRE